MAPKKLLGLPEAKCRVPAEPQQRGLQGGVLTQDRITKTPVPGDSLAW